MTKINSTIEVPKANFPFVCLPPWAQEKKEQKAIVNAIDENSELSEEIGGRAYDLQKNETGYLLKTEDGYTMQIDITYLPINCCGPARFELFFHELQKPAEFQIEETAPTQ